MGGIWGVTGDLVTRWGGEEGSRLQRGDISLYVDVAMGVWGGQSGTPRTSLQKPSLYMVSLCNVLSLCGAGGCW